MPFIVAGIVIVSAVLVGVIVFLVSSIAGPRQVQSLADMVKQAKYSAAVRLAKKIIAKSPHNPDAHYFLAMAYLGDNKPELALMELKIVNQISNFDGLCKEVPFRKKIAELFLKFNQPEEALKEYLLLVKKEPNVAEHYLAIGNLFEERERTAKAAEYYQKAISIDPRSSEGHHKLGLILYKQKHIPEAKAEFEMALKTNPEDYTAYFYLGRILKDNQDYPAALTALERAQKDPEFKIKALVERGGCYMSMSNFDRAVSELERAIKLSGDEAANDTLYARYFLSLCHEKNRNIELAIEQWEKIYSRKPNFRDVAEKLSQYQEFRTDDRIKDYMTANAGDFAETCKKLAATMNLSLQDVSEIPNGMQIVGVESQSKWRNARKMPKLVRFLRVAELIDESAIRIMYEEMRKLNVTRGIIISSSNFSRMAMDFAETRPIDLYNKEKLQELLKLAASGATEPAAAT